MLTINYEGKKYNITGQIDKQDIIDEYLRLEYLMEESEEKVINSSTIPNSSTVSEMERDECVPVVDSPKIDLPSVPDFDYETICEELVNKYVSHAQQESMLLEKIALQVEAITKYLKQ